MRKPLPSDEALRRAYERGLQDGYAKIAQKIDRTVASASKAVEGKPGLVEDRWQRLRTDLDLFRDRLPPELWGSYGLLTVRTAYFVTTLLRLCGELTLHIDHLTLMAANPRLNQDES